MLGKVFLAPYNTSQLQTNLRMKFTESLRDYMHHLKRVYLLAAVVVLLGVIACRVVPTATFYQSQADAQRNVTTTTPIKHVVFLLMENRTFDHMFGRFPGVNGYTEAQSPNPAPDFEHNGPSALAAIDGGKMDEFP